MATPTPMKEETAHAQTLSPSALAPSFAVSPSNKYQCEEKRNGVGEFFKTSSSKEWEEKQTANESQHEERRNGDGERFKMSMDKLHLYGQDGNTSCTTISEMHIHGRAHTYVNI